LGVNDLLAAIGILIGLAGIVSVVFPGLTIVVASVAIWALFEQTAAGWVAMAFAVVIGTTAMVLKYLHPGRKLKQAGIPGRQIFFALVIAVIGFFVVPVIGAFLGFVGGIYALELIRVGKDQAWASTVHALKAVGQSIGIELIAAFLIAAVWVAAAIWG
jgi:uncharacterized protein YqgC (DUF456 family)